jgi:integrase
MDQKHIDTLKNHYSNQTFKNIKLKLNKIFTQMNITKIDDLDTDKFINICNEYINLGTRSTLINHTNTLYKLMGKEPSDKFKEYVLKSNDEAIKYRNERNKNKINNEDIDCSDMAAYWFDKYNNHKSIRKVKSKDKTYDYTSWKFCRETSCKYILYSILSIAPIRITELTKCKYEDDKKHNYLDLDNKILHIRVHKNSNKKSGKDRTITLTDDLIEHIKKHKDYTGSEWLMCNSKKDPINGSDMFNKLSNATKKYCNDKDIKYIPGRSGIHSFRSKFAKKECDNIGIKIDIDDFDRLVKMAEDLGNSPMTLIRDYITGKK